ncbi:MAG: hypothetical protein EOO54_25580 [Haliea sp.]|nr:MAG: hypothetical protein EOO54_25580 [Haliea sp.]
MKTRSYFRAVAPAAALSALLLVTACGSDDSDPDPDPTSSETAEEGSSLSKSDLEDALLTEDDVEGLDDEFEQTDVDDSEIDSDDLVDGDEACAEFLDEDYGTDEEEEVKTKFEGPTVTVYSTVELYAAGEAEEELEATRDLFSDCTSFTVDLDGQEVDVDIQTIELDELDGYDVGDEGMALNLDFSVEGTPVLQQGYTLVRVDDVLTISAASTTETLGDDIMLTITEAAVDRLESVLKDA